MLFGLHPAKRSKDSIKPHYKFTLFLIKRDTVGYRSGCLGGKMWRCINSVPSVLKPNKKGKPQRSFIDSPLRDPLSLPSLSVFASAGFFCGRTFLPATCNRQQNLQHNLVRRFQGAQRYCAKSSLTLSGLRGSARIHSTRYIPESFLRQLLSERFILGYPWSLHL